MRTIFCEQVFVIGALLLRWLGPILVLGWGDSWGGVRGHHGLGWEGERELVKERGTQAGAAARNESVGL